MKQLRTLVLTLLLLTALAITGHAASASLNVKDPAGQYHARTVRTVSLVLDGQALEADIPAFILDNRTLVPVRIVSEYLGASVTWKQETQQVQIENGQTSITLAIGSAEAMVNGHAVQLYDGVPATMAAVGSLTRTMVPLRFVSEQLGAEVTFDNEASAVYISSVQEPVYALSAPQLENGIITVSASVEAAPNIFSLPGRVVADFPGGVLSGSSFGTVPVNGTAVSAVRYNQYDTGYDGSRVARVVLDLQEGYTAEDLILDFSAGVLTVLQPEAAELPPEEDTPPEEDPDAPLVVLDAGHGGTDIGAEGVINEIQLTEATIGYLEGWLTQDENYTPVRTHAADTFSKNTERAAAANSAGASLLLSVHGNSDPYSSDSYGLECYPQPPGRTHHEDSLRLAHLIADKFGAAGQRLRGNAGVRYIYYAGDDESGYEKQVVEESDSTVYSEQTFGLLEKTDCPAVLVEQCFVTSEADVAAWGTDDGCRRAARLYYEAICEYFGTEPLPGT